MVIHDRIYGARDIKEPVLLELIHSDPVIRLKRINQAGASSYLFPWKDVTRYDHSVGVMLLLRDYGATTIEQIAGLLHDIPHTAFSHVADFVFENRNHEYHELFHESIIENSEIAEILKKYKIPRKVAHPEKFTLLERPIPDLCADRIDYALRDHFAWKKERESIAVKLTGLTVVKGEFIFTDPYVAEAFARDYLELDRRIWADPREASLYELLAQAIRHALDKRILTSRDLFTDDEAVYRLLKDHGDPYIQKKLAYLTPTFRIESATRENHHLYIRTKSRFVDPKVIISGKNSRLSEISPQFKKMLGVHRTHTQQGWYVNVYRE